ncbi:RcnB family protein [uncultured Roseibium sp.]|uniref:RcnB family protein n=1 Tax=uncultured Roseibium sp. TaxID=1936171 RepID=UPI00321806BA
MQKNNGLHTAIIVAMACVLGASSSFAAGAPQQPPQKQEQPRKQEQSKKQAPQPAKSKTQPKAAQPGKKPGSQSQKPAAKAQQPNWKKKGGQMPQNARGPQVDYRQHNLKKPPEGYRWVRNGDDFVLIAITTGIISAIVNATR